MRNLVKKCFNDSDNCFNKINEAFTKRKKLFIVTLNPEGVMSALKNKDLYDLYMREDSLLVCESVAMKYAIKKIMKKNISYYPGIETFDNIIRSLKGTNTKVYLYGATEKNVKDLYDKYKTMNVNVCGYNNGYAKNEKDLKARKRKIIDAKPDFIACALGVLKQELFLNDIYNNTSHGVFIGVGGSFDVLSGNKKRAPKFFRKLKLEWLYRIIREPRRIKGFFQKNVRFIWLVKKESRYAKD